jgi:Fibronectin type III domain
VTAVWDGERFAVIVADSGGSVFAAFGTTEFGWTAWSSVAQGSTIPGGPVTASWNYNDTQMSLFLCDPNGGVYTIATRGPDAPTNLHVVSVTDSTIDIAWADNSGDQDGFRVSYGGSGSPKSFPPGARSASLTGLQSGQTYAISVVAFNDSTGVSASSNVINVTTDAAPQAASITAVVTLVPSDGTNAYALVVTGANFASGETVDLSIVWTLDDTGTYNDTVQALGGSLGAGTFSFPFFGNTPDGLCGGTNPNTDEQTFQVQAKGRTSGSTATATARFACP